MRDGKVEIAGVGCCLVDRIYDCVSFGSPEFLSLMSRAKGDGGLVPGALVFEEELEKFSGRRFPEILKSLTHGREADKVNVGGPCIVALINLSQLTAGISHVKFYGCRGDDEVGRRLFTALRRTPVDISCYHEKPGLETASSTVLSDPDYDEGNGERIFVNTIGASWKVSPGDLDKAFYDADITVYGGTAIVPGIHDHLNEILPIAKQHGSLTIVNTVFDTRNERMHPDRRWPLGASDETYRYIDLLLADHEEALRLSGKGSIPAALDFFREKGVRAVVVTGGARDISYYAAGGPFVSCPATTLPVSARVGAELRSGERKGDTTGCGDNFAGAVVASVAQQMHCGATAINLGEACCWGVVSGGFTCFHYGGTFFEKHPGEKLALLRPYYEAYIEQVGGLPPA